MTTATETLLLNAAPLFAIAIAYGAVSAVVVPAVWRARRRATASDVALATVFPAVAVLALTYAVIVSVRQEPVEGHLWLSFALFLLALLPALLFFARLAQAGAASGGERMYDAEARSTALDRELTAVTDLSNALVRAHTPDAVARTLIDSASALVGAEFGAVLAVDLERKRATGILGLAHGDEVPWVRGVELDLRSEPSGTASAVFGAGPLAIFDADASPLLNRRLSERAGVKSAAFVPVTAEGRVLAVLVVASLGERRLFSAEELALLQSLGNETALALDRVRSSSALAEALERERVIARIAGRFRTQLDLHSIMDIAVEETARALGAQCGLVRLGPSESASVAVEWHTPELEGVAGKAPRLPVSNLALVERRTVLVDDLDDVERLDPSIRDDVAVLREVGSRAVLATPIVVFDELIGVLAIHRAQPRPWSASDVAVAEAVARETGMALHIARLLQENQEQLRLQKSLFGAAQHVTAQLELNAVLQRLVDELASLLDVEATDVFLRHDRRRSLRCAAVHGLPASLVGLEFPLDDGLAGKAIGGGEPLIGTGGTAAPVQHPAYREFTDSIVAPIVRAGETRGVLGAAARGRAFTSRDADVLGAFASLAGLALRNAETFEERSRQARVQRGFSRIATVLGQPLSLTETLDAAAQAAAEALGGDAAAVLMPFRDGVLELAGSFELPPTLARTLREGLPPAASVLSLSAEERRVIAAPSIAEDGRFDADWKALARSAGFDALLAVPLQTTRGEGFGVVVVLFAEEHRFSDDDLELGGQLAQAARGALARSEIYESERSARALAQQLARTGSMLATELDPDAVLEEVVQRAPSLLGADACVIRTLEGEELVVTAASGVEAEETIGMRSPTTAILAGDIFQSRQPASVADAAPDSRYAEADPVLAAGFRSYLGVPLVGPEGAVHGVLAVYARRPRRWRQEEIEALEALASNTSAALSNAKLFTSVALDRERSYAILANVADGIVAVDRDAHVVLWNAAAERITGVAAKHALGRTVEDVLQRSLSGTGQRGRLVSIERGTEEVWLSVNEAVMRDPVGAVAGRIFAFRDISSDRLVEEMKSEFVATVSHELRGPLTSIYGFAETMLREDVLFEEDERRTFLGYIASESERLTSIVDALLNVARLDTGDLEVELVPTDVRTVVSSVVAALHKPALNGHRFVLDLPDAPLAAQADPDKLQQILAALLDNAVKFSHEGGTVTVTARAAGETVEVSVEDEGVGIPQSEQERIFRKFYRGSDATAGTGLGLFIAQGLVSAMGGHLWVRSEEGKGAQFTFDVPAATHPLVGDEGPAEIAAPRQGEDS